MAILESVVGRIVEKGIYPYDIIESITIDKNRRGTILRFTPESVRILESTCRIIGDDVSVELITDTIASKLTASEKKQITALKMKDIGKVTDG